jgi:urease accessory protein
MRRALSIRPAGKWLKAEAVDTLTLGWDDRHRRRCRLSTDQGLAILLDLAHATRLNDGDALVLEDGALIRVVAAPEPVMRIGAGVAGLARLAYHLGNRHLAVEIDGEALVIRADAVIADMVRGLGGTVETQQQPFTPEPGAYDGRTDALPQLPPHHHHHHG